MQSLEQELIWTCNTQILFMLYRTEQQANIEQAAYSEILCVCELDIYIYIYTRTFCCSCCGVSTDRPPYNPLHYTVSKTGKYTSSNQQDMLANMI